MPGSQPHKFGSATTMATLDGGDERGVLSVPARAVLAPQRAGRDEDYADSDVDTVVGA